MAEALNLALSFTAIDAASGYLSRLESRLGSLGKAGEKAQADFNAMRDSFNRGLQGLGLAWSGWRLVKPGLDAASELERAGLAARTFLDDGAKSAEQIRKELKAVGRTAIEISQSQPITAAQAADFENLLLRKGFPAEMVAGASASALALARLRGESPESIAELTEMFKEQFGAKNGADLTSALDWVAKANADPEEVRSALIRTGQQLHSMGLGLNEAVTAAGLLKGKVNRPGAALDAMLGGVMDTYANPASESARFAQSFGLSFFKDGKFIGLSALQEQLKKRFAAMGAADRLAYFEKLFGGSGGKAAETLFTSDSIREFSKAASLRQGAVDQVKAQNQGLANSVIELGNAWHNMLSQMYAPLLPALSATTRGLKSAFSGIGGILGEHPGAAGALGLAGAGVMGYGVFRMLTGFGGALGKGASLMGALSGLGTGIALDKATEVAMGQKSTLVFVTNWPPAMLTGGVAAAGGLVDQFGRAIGSAGGGIAGGVGAGAVGAAGTGMFPALSAAAGAAWAAAPIATIIALTTAAIGGALIGKYIVSNFLGGVADATGVHPWARLEEWVEEFSARNEEQRILNQIHLAVHVDEKGRITTDTNDPNMSVEVSNTTARGRINGR